MIKKLRRSRNIFARAVMYVLKKIGYVKFGDIDKADTDFEVPGNIKSLGYYATGSVQVLQTKDHVSRLWFIPSWRSVGQAINDIKEAIEANPRIAVTYDCSHQLFHSEGKLKRPRADSVEQLKELRHRWIVSGVYDQIDSLVIQDEPYLYGLTVNDLAQAALVLRQTFKDKKLAIIYSPGHGFDGLEMFDMIGLDDYRLDTAVLKTFSTEIMPRLSQGQEVVLVPNCGFSKRVLVHLRKFVEFAGNYPNVNFHILGFLWSNYGYKYEKWLVGLEKYTELQKEYRYVGNKVLERQ